MNSTIGSNRHFVWSIDGEQNVNTGIFRAVVLLQNCKMECASIGKKTDRNWLFSYFENSPKNELNLKAAILDTQFMALLISKIVCCQSFTGSW